MKDGESTLGVVPGRIEERKRQTGCFTERVKRYLLPGCVLATLAIGIIGATWHVASRRTAVFFGPNQGAEAVILDAIRESRESIYLAMFYMSNPALVDALIEAKNRGVEVCAIFDDSQRRSFRYLEHGVRLRMHGVPVRYGAPSGKMHSKFAVVDAKRVLTGSYNWTISAEEVNVEDFVRIDSRRAAETYQQQFVTIWEAGENP